MWELNKRCFKIDKTNAKAMIDGYLKNGALIRQAIWCAVKDALFPMLITLNRTRTKFRMSSIGESLRSDDYLIPYKYVADLDSEYPIKNDHRLWETVCSNGLFDVWVPDAPYERFADAKSDRAKFRIQLIRVWQIREEFAEDEIIHASDRIDHLNSSCDRMVTPIKPVICDGEFERIKALLISSVKDFGTK
ncbi:MAG: hypothetical protein ABIF19_16155 [Planctomycetota bacterium]